MRMTTTAEARIPGSEREAGWRDIAGLVLARIGARLRLIAAAVRPLAWVLLAVAAGTLLIALPLGWIELAVIALVLAVVLALCALFLIGRTAYDVHLDLARTRVVVGERAVGALTLSNRGSRAILPSRVVLPVGAGRGEFGIKRLAPGEEAEELFAIPTHHRGVVSVGPVSVVRGDPLGLFERAHRRDDPVDLFVHPRTVRLRRPVPRLPARPRRPARGRPVPRRRVVPRPARVPARRRPAASALALHGAHRHAHGPPVRGDPPFALRRSA